MSFEFDFICDCHTHSEHSFDGCERVEDMCNQAISLGIDVLTVTEHCEVHSWIKPQEAEFGDFSKSIPQAIESLKENQLKYAGKLTLLRGIELGEPVHDSAAADEILALDDYDFVLASVHNVRGKRDFFWLEYTEESAKELLHTYFNELLEIASWNKFDSLSHLTYPLRYFCGVHNIAIDITDYLPVIDKIFAQLIKNGKALEVNSSGLRQEIGTTMPDRFLLERYYSLGGRLITIGSDAHKKEDLGKGINEALKMLESIGFTDYCYYKNRKPVMVAIK